MFAPTHGYFDSDEIEVEWLNNLPFNSSVYTRHLLVVVIIVIVVVVIEFEWGIIVGRVSLKINKDNCYAKKQKALIR